MRKILLLTAVLFSFVGHAKTALNQESARYNRALKQAIAQFASEKGLTIHSIHSVYTDSDGRITKASFRTAQGRSCDEREVAFHSDGTYLTGITVSFDCGNVGGTKTILLGSSEDTVTDTQFFKAPWMRGSEIGIVN